MAEFALVFPIMLLLLAAAIDFGRLFYAYVAVENAAKEGALFGARSPLCADGSNANCGNPNNVIWHVQNEAPNIGTRFETTVACRTPTGALVQPINDCLDGYTYQVNVEYPFQLITPIIGSILNPTLTLRSQAQSTVISDAFDPSGLELLIWVNNTSADNGPVIGTACSPADASGSPNFYYAPCQDSLNVDNYLEVGENVRIDYKVRVRNTGNLTLTGITYDWAENDSGIGTPGTCGSLPSTLAQRSPAVFCTFSRAAVAGDPIDGLSDHTMQGVAEGNAGSLSTGATNGTAIVKVVPAPKLAVTLRASQYRLGGSGDGLLGNPDFANGSLDLARDPASTVSEIQNPTAWFQLRVVNQGGTAEAFSVTVRQDGVPVPVPCSVPSTLAAGGQSGSTFSCLFPRTLDATQPYTFEATAGATNAVILGGTQRVVPVTTAICTAPELVIPNLVDRLSPTADGTTKTVAQATSLWGTAGFTGAVSASGSGTSVISQGRTAYTCADPAVGITIRSQ